MRDDVCDQPVVTVPHTNHVPRIYQMIWETLGLSGFANTTILIAEDDRACRNFSSLDWTIVALVSTSTSFTSTYFPGTSTGLVHLLKVYWSTSVISSPTLLWKRPYAFQWK